MRQEILSHLKKEVNVFAFFKLQDNFSCYLVSIRKVAQSSRLKKLINCNSCLNRSLNFFYFTHKSLFWQLTDGRYLVYFVGKLWYRKNKFHRASESTKII